MHSNNAGDNNAPLKTPLKYTIEGNHFETVDQYKTGAQLKSEAGIPLDVDLYLEIKEPYEDELIENDEVVDLARPGKEKFYSKEKPFSVELIVNLKPKPWTEKTINFEQVITLAYDSYDSNPGKGYTVTYDRGPHQNPEGSMVKGQSVFVKHKMIFNVKQTDKS